LVADRRSKRGREDGEQRGNKEIWTPKKEMGGEGAGEGGGRPKSHSLR